MGLFKPGLGGSSVLAEMLKKKLQDLKPTLTTALARVLGKEASSLPVPLAFLLVFL